MQHVHRSQPGLPTSPGRETHRLNLSLRRAAVAALVVLAAVLFGGGAAQAQPMVSTVMITSTPAADDTYGTGEMIEFTVTFDQDVTVVGTPEFEFCLGSSDTISCSVGMPPPARRRAAYDSGSGTTTMLVFSYTVIVGDVDDNGIWAGSQTIKLEGGTIQGTVGMMDATLTHTEVGTPTGHKVNGEAPTAPTVSNVAVTSTPAADDTYGTGEMIEFTVTFDQDVTVVGTPEFEFCLGSWGAGSCTEGASPPSRRRATLSSGSGTPALVFSYTVVVGDVDDNGIWAGNQDRTIKLDPGDTIQGTVGMFDAVLTHAAVGTLTGHKVGIGTLVSNAEKERANNSNKILAQQFTTGDNTLGYLLSEVRLRATDTRGDHAARTYVTIKDDAGGVPGTEVGRLNNPATFAHGATTAGDTDALNTFAATGSIRLAADTAYWVVVNEESEGSRLHIAVTTVDAEDSGALSGWSIADGRRQKDAGTDSSWGSDGAVLLMNLRGHVATDPAVVPGPPQSFTATPGDTLVELRWAAPASDGGTAITRYEYRHAAGATVPAATTWTRVGRTARSARVTGLTNDRQYTFEVRAWNSVDPGPAATAMLATISCDEPSLTGRQQIWSGTLTVGNYVNRDYGFSPENYGGLSAGTFTVSEVSYKIKGVQHSLYEGTYGAPTLQFAIDKALPDEVQLQEGQLILHICDQSFDWSEVSRAAISTDLHTYIWSDPELDWRLVTERALWLSVPGSGGFMPIANSDATLSALTLSDASDGSDIPLDQPFAPGTRSYTASVDNDVDEITITPTPTNNAASVAYLDDSNTAILDADTKSGQQVSLTVDANTVKVQVTAADATTNTYTVLVTRADTVAGSAVLVTNTGQTAGGILNARTLFTYAQGFSTGNSAAELGSVTLADLTGVEAGESLVVSLYSDSAGSPGTSLHTLTAPATLSNEDATFTVPTGTTVTLEATTSYFIHIAAVGTSVVYLSRTHAGAEDSSGTAGWSLADNVKISTSGAAFVDHEAPARALRLSINRPNTAPTAADKTVTTAQDTAYTFEADDFGFTDTNAGDTLASVKIVTLPALGTLALDGAAVSLNDVVTKAEIDGNMLTFTPVVGASGTGYASFTFKVNDGTVDSASPYTMIIDVTATARRPQPLPVAQGRGSPPSTPPPDDVVGYLENPGAASFQSGIGLISGWTCDADEVEITLNGEPQEAAYGTERVDTAGVCGDTDNGFGLLFNWNLLGDGEHEVVALVDGVELDRATVTVTTLGAEFLRDVTGTCTAADFPTGDETVTLAWQQTQQNFVIAEGAAPAGPTNRAGTPGVGYLENPGPNSFQSGIGVLSGWVCEGAEVIIELNGEPQPAAYGTERLDTEEACGDTANGFGLLFNWNLLGEGEHEVVAFVDGEELGRATVRVTTVGEGVEEEFLRGAEGECVVEDFPMPGETVTLEWQQNSQNFVIIDNG